MAAVAFYDDAGTAYYEQPGGGYGTTDPSPPAPAAGDWWTNAPYINQTPYKLNPNTGKPELMGTARVPTYLDVGGGQKVQSFRGEQVPESVARSMGVSFQPLTAEQFKTPKSGFDIGGALLNIAAGSVLPGLNLGTGTPFIDKLLGGALQQLITTGQVNPEQLAKSAAIGQLTPEVAKKLTETTGLPANIVNAVTNVGVAGAVGGAPAALSTAAGAAGSEAIKAATAQPGAAISTPTAESQPEYGTPTTPVYSEPTRALETALSTPISPLPVAETQAPAQPREPEQFPQLKPDGTVMTPEEVAAARPDLFPGGVLPQPGEETTYFPEGGMVTAPTEVPGQLSPGDQPIYDQETGRALAPAEVAAQYPDLYPEGRLPQPGEDTVFTPPQAGTSIPSKTISQLFSLTGGGPAAYGAGVLGAATPSKEFGLAAAPSRALGEGDVEAPETGKKRRQVWNVASLRNLQDALGI